MANILIIKHGSIGDYVLSLGAMKSIKSFYNDKKIFLLTTISMNKIFNLNPFIDGTYIDDRKSILLTIVKLSTFIKKNDISIIIDLQNSKRTQIYHFFTRLIFAKILISSSRKFSHKRYLIPPHGSEHVCQGLENQLKILGIKKFYKPTLYWLKDETFNLPTKRPFAVIIPGTSKSGFLKQWPVENWIDLCKSIYELGYDLFLTGSEHDQQIISAIISKCPFCLKFCLPQMYPHCYLFHLILT